MMETMRRWRIELSMLAVVGLVALLVWMGDAEPALPKCPNGRSAHVECRP